MGKDIMRLKLKCVFLTALTLAASMAWADTLELKNGSLIKGKFLRGTEKIGRASCRERVCYAV